MATKHLDLPACRAIAGGGVFPRFTPQLQLTASGHPKRSVWRIPGFFAPRDGVALSYHGDPKRWHQDGDDVLLNVVVRGQEFVLDCDHYPAVLGWLRGILDLAS